MLSSFTSRGKSSPISPFEIRHYLKKAWIVSMDTNDDDCPEDIVPEVEEKCIDDHIDNEMVQEENLLEVETTHGIDLAKTIQIDFPDYSGALKRNESFRSHQGLHSDFMQRIWVMVKDGCFGVKCGSHNHNLYDRLEGYPYSIQQTKEEHDTIVRIKQNGVKTSKILTTLKEKTPNNCTTMKQVKNVLYRYRRSVRHPRSQLQHLHTHVRRNNVRVAMKSGGDAFSVECGLLQWGEST
ncbi:hypothetical protein RIF29_30777 [Crotalaria pallida]|uniref:Uncharacterized protein n=1 Tax=Crotalaria pallida TaxID=3830 RepID=A0AAN9EGJ3_CROPI